MHLLKTAGRPPARDNGLRVEVLGRVDEDAWNARVASVDEGAYRQTTLYGRYQALWRREAPLYFVAHDEDGQIVGQLLVLLGAIGAWGLAHRPLSRLSLPLARRLLPQIYWAEGPLVFAPQRRIEVQSALLEAVAAEAQRRGCVHLEGMPSFYGDDAEATRPLDREVFTGCDFAAHEVHTLRVDLRRESDELWSRLKREARTKVRKARSQDIRIEPLDGDPARLRQAHAVVGQTAARNATAPFQWDDFVHSFRFHQRHGLAAAFVSLVGDEVLSYQRAAFFNGVAVLGGVAYGDACRERGLYGNDLMQWHMIEWAKGQGMRWLDYGGAVPGSADPKLKGIYGFKAKWGGDLVEYDYFRRPLRSSWRGRAFSVAAGAGRRLLATHR